MPLSKKIKDTLDNRIPISIDTKETDYVHASVLVPIFHEEGDCKILCTKRSTKVENHKGQISFPGGVVDGKDRSWKETALREAMARDCPPSSTWQWGFWPLDREIWMVDTS